MENKDFNLTVVAKDTVVSVANSIVLRAYEKTKSLSAGNFYRNLHTKKINDLDDWFNQLRPMIKNTKNKKIKELYAKGFDALMSISGLESEEEIVNYILRANTCIQDLMYLLETGKGK